MDMARRTECVDAPSPNLEEIRAWALRRGFTHEQFGYAVDRVGSDPHDVANELRRHLQMASLREDSAV